MIIRRGNVSPEIRVVGISEDRTVCVGVFDNMLLLAADVKMKRLDEYFEMVYTSWMEKGEMNDRGR
jgi:hypothetical protein